MPDMCHDVFVDSLKVLDKYAEHQLDHLAVEGLIDEGQADVKIDRTLIAQVVFEYLVLGVEIVQILLEIAALVLRDARDDLGADDREDARVDQDGHGQDLSLGLDARAEDDRGVVILHRLGAEYIDAVLNQELLEFQGLLVALDAVAFFSWHVLVPRFSALS